MLNSKLECRCSTVDVEQINSRFELACYYHPVSWNTVAGYVSCTHQIKLPNCFHNGTLYISCFCFCLCPFFFCFAFVFLPILVVKKLPLAVQQTSLAEEKDRWNIL